MKRSYRVNADGAFVIKPGVTAKASFDEHGRACTFTLFGEMSEDEVFQMFDLLVPAEKRGSKKPQDMLECMGACLRIVFYKNVTLSTGALGKTTSDPAAIISFRRSDCKAAVAEANKQGWHLNQNQQAAKPNRAN